MRWAHALGMLRKKGKVLRVRLKFWQVSTQCVVVLVKYYKPGRWGQVRAQSELGLQPGQLAKECTVAGNFLSTTAFTRASYPHYPHD